MTQVAQQGELFLRVPITSGRAPAARVAIAVLAAGLLAGLSACSPLPITSFSSSRDTVTVPAEVDEPVEATSEAPPVEAEPEEPVSTLTVSQQAAIRSAESYLSFMAFSRQGLIDQLSSEYGDQFPVEDATFAVDSLNMDWNVQAAKSAQSYLEMMGFSCQGMIDQLSSEYGEQFTVEQATFGAQQVGLC